MLLLDDTLEMHVDEEVSGFIGHERVTWLDSNGPESLYAEQVLEVHDVDDFKRSRLRYVIDMSMLSIHVQKEHLEAAEALYTQLGTFKLLLIAHNLIEYISSTPLV